MTDLTTLLTPYTVTGPPAPVAPWSELARRTRPVTLAALLSHYTAWPKDVRRAA